VNEIQDTIRLEFHWVSPKILSIKSSKLGLALVILTKISLLEGDPGMDFINSNSEFVLDSLHCEILSHGFELIAYVRVVPFLLPLLLQ
jgi:hypothetical protein